MVKERKFYGVKESTITNKADVGTKQFDAKRLAYLRRRLARAHHIDELFDQEDGLDALFGLMRDNLPERLFETAYALACDVAAADGTLRETELRLLEEIRYELNIDRLHAAAIERGARARHLSL